MPVDGKGTSAGADADASRVGRACVWACVCVCGRGRRHEHGVARGPRRQLRAHLGLISASVWAVASAVLRGPKPTTVGQRVLEHNKHDRAITVCDGSEPAHSTAEHHARTASPQRLSASPGGEGAGAGGGVHSAETERLGLGGTETTNHASTHTFLVVSELVRMLDS